MDNFKSISGVNLNRNVVKRLKQEFKNWSMFSVGKTKTNVTPNGGIHYTGKQIETNCISFEIRKGNAYIIISLFEYPKGVVFHTHIFLPDIEKRNTSGWVEVVTPVYEKVKQILEEVGK